MAISFRRYIDITSGVGAGVRVPGRQLTGRLFTTNPLAPAGGILSFEEAADVAGFFGSQSEEYKRAAFYFGWISKLQTRARQISFERYIPTAIPATLRATQAAPALEQFAAVSHGSLALTINGQRQIIAERDFSATTSYAEVAAVLESGVRAVNDDPLWADATVAFDAQTRTFTLAVGQPGACSMGLAEDADSGDPIASLLGWNAFREGIASPGYAAQTVTDTLNRSADADNNFGSFLFLGDPGLSAMEEAAAFAQLSNVGFLYCQRVAAAQADAIRNVLKGYDGVALTEYDPEAADEYPEMVPMIILAATDYTRRNAAQNYMFQQFNLTPTVTDNARANELDALRVNYYGRTQQAGQTIDFYQRGVLQGAIQDMNVYANEMWLKDRAGADIMTLQLALPGLSANDSGRSLVLGCLRNVIDMALRNGSISINKPLNYTQKAFVTEVTGDDTAWVQVQAQGYWYDAQIQEYTADDRVEYKIVYLLLYAKDDMIRKVEGTHSLI